MTTATANEFSLASDNVLITPEFLLAIGSDRTVVIRKADISVLAISAKRTSFVVYVGGTHYESRVTPRVGQAVADWFFGQPLPPPEITSLEQNAFEAAYREYLRVKAL